MLCSWQPPIVLLHDRHHHSPHSLNKRGIATPVKTRLFAPLRMLL
jgi:hypothetical protein